MLTIYRKRLITIWVIGFAIPFLLIFVQYFSGKYGSNFSGTLGWLTALSLPTILLMVGVMISNPAVPTSDSEMNDEESLEDEESARSEKIAKERHENFVFKLASLASVAYMLLLILTLLVEPISISRPQELMKDSKLWLAIPDSLISLLIGYFFGKR